MIKSSDVRYRLSAVGFLSIQGEGHYAGTPSIWVRTFGCNLKCPGFPCDTEYSWNPSFKNQHQSYTSEEVYNKLKALITDKHNPTGSLVHPLTGNDIHLVFTGGEPLLKKYQKMIQEVVSMFRIDNDLVHFTMETNGTQCLTEDFYHWLIHDMNVIPFFSISPKLEAVSGELLAVNVENITEILDAFPGQLKFVADASDECEAELLYFIEKLKYNSGLDYEYWVMPLGETREDQLQIAPIVEKYQQMGFKIATRNHTYIWSNDKNR